jgi:hypothetical protein
MSSHGALDAIDRILNRGGDADDVLRDVVKAMVEHGGCIWAGISFVEEDKLVGGPHVGEPEESARVELPIVFKGTRVAELAVDGCGDRAFLERVALIISPYCLVGWDLGGASWDTAS